MTPSQGPDQGFDRDAERIALSDEDFKAELALVIHNCARSAGRFRATAIWLMTLFKKR